MHRRALTCRLCQQQFFPASLKFHLKVCATRQEHVELPCDYCDERFLCTMLKVHMNFCEQRKRRARTTKNIGLRSPDSTETRRQGGVGGPGTDNASSMPNSGADQHHHPLRMPQTACEYAREPPLQAKSHDVPNSTPLGGGGNRDGVGCGERLGDDRGLEENKDSNVAVTASDGRIACANCQRRFSPDRVSVHQNICERVNPPSARDTSERGNSKAARSKTARFAFPRAESRRRKSSRLVVGEILAAARARGARGRSARGEKGSIQGGHAIDDAGGIKYCGSEDHQAWRKLAPTQAQADTNTTPRASPPGKSPSAGAECRGRFFSSILDLKGSYLPKAERQNQQQRHRRRGTPHRRESWDSNHRRARRPSSAAGLVSSSSSSSKDTVPLAPVEGCRRRCSVGRAESTSCSPVRLRRGCVSTATPTAEARSARNEEGWYARQSSAVSAGGGKFGSGGGSEVELVPSSSTSRRGAAAADRGVAGERLSGGMGFFAPFREGGRVQLLK